jgi:hypothetical protein
VLAKSSGSGGAIVVDPSEPRLCALLAAAHLRRPTAGALAHLHKAAERWSEGHEALATMHLALSQVAQLDQPEADAQRLFLADGLLNAGFEANAIIDAIEAGGGALERIQKFDPDQPRVPAGSGRTSGEWTSTGDGSSELPQLAPQPEVNSSTITETAYYDACGHATTDCIDAAGEANRADILNDNEEGWKADIKKCRDADLVCNTMSIAIEDLPLPLSGGVIFPHRGVVLIRKGQQDRYLPPLPGGRRPYWKSV